MRVTVAIMALFSACHPNLEPVTNCIPFSEFCSGNGLPMVCSADRRSQPMGDLGRCVASEVCVVEEGHAHCRIAPLPTTDGGTVLP